MKTYKFTAHIGNDNKFNKEIYKTLFTLIMKAKNDRIKEYPSEKMDLIVIMPKDIFYMIKDINDFTQLNIKYTNDFNDFILLLNKEKCNIDDILDMEFAKVQIEI